MTLLDTPPPAIGLSRSFSTYANPGAEACESYLEGYGVRPSYDTIKQTFQILLVQFEFYPTFRFEPAKMQRWIEMLNIYQQ